MSAELEIFDRALLRRRRDRAARRDPDARFLLRQVDEDLMDRIDFVQRSFARALVIGVADSALPAWLEARGVQVIRCDSSAVFADEAGGIAQLDPDRLMGLEGGYDLLVAPGGLDLVNDLPGMLVQCRRLMQPDAMFVGVMAGAGSLLLLREALQRAEEAEGRAAAPRLHPQIDVRAAGDLLSRAGFVQPVADSFGLDLRYRAAADLIADIRAHGAANALLRRDVRPFGKTGYRAMEASLMAHADDKGRFGERVEILTVTAWTPPPRD
jgi:hypothetical protein